MSRMVDKFTALFNVSPDSNTIEFYSTKDENGYMSNFFRSGVKTLNLGYFTTTEHFFQAMKYYGTGNHEYFEKIRNVEKPMAAAELGRNRAVPMRADWEKVKDDVMRLALAYKFAQHSDLMHKLLGTDQAKLVEHTVNDKYWADAGDGSGKNMLGILLMELRNIIRTSLEAYPDFSSHIEEDNFWNMNPDYKTLFELHIIELETKLFTENS